MKLNFGANPDLMQYIIIFDQFDTISGIASAGRGWVSTSRRCSVVGVFPQNESYVGYSHMFMNVYESIIFINDNSFVALEDITKIS